MSRPAVTQSNVKPAPVAETVGSGHPWGYRLVQWLEPSVLLGPTGLWLLLLMVLPILLILEISLVPGLRPGQATTGYGLGNYLEILQPTYLRVLWRSLTFATGTTGLCLLLGFPVAYWLALIAPKRWRNLLLVVFILPLWTSSLLRTYAWITLLRPSGLINLVLSGLGLPTQDLM
ncbi:MAG: ABC transporter permease, partial [Cyanobacteria bacterium P01_A01_bin.114]